MYKRYHPEEIGSIEYRHFIDVLNKKGRWIGYFPIYDSDDSVIISYILLSAGIDGKLDNVFDASNKLHINDWKQKLSLYNPNELDGLYSPEMDMYLRGVNIYSEVFNRSKKYVHLYWNTGCIEVRPYNAEEEKSDNKDLLIY